MEHVIDDTDASRAPVGNLELSGDNRQGSRRMGGPAWVLCLSRGGSWVGLRVGCWVGRGDGTRLSPGDGSWLGDFVGGYRGWILDGHGEWVLSG